MIWWAKILLVVGFSGYDDEHANKDSWFLIFEKINNEKKNYVGAIFKKFQRYDA